MNNSFTVGSRVIMVTIPPPVISDAEKFPETIAIFQKALGLALTVQGFNELGMAELCLDDNGSEIGTNWKHSIWVEPEYLSPAPKP